MPTFEEFTSDRGWIEQWRKATPHERLQRASAMSGEAIAGERQEIAQAYPDWTRQEVNLRRAEIHYGRELIDKVREHLKSGRT